MARNKRRSWLHGALGVLMSALMSLTMVQFAFAAAPTGGVKLTGGSAKEHTLNAYQVFSGTYSNSGSVEKLSNVEWGTGVNGTVLLAALKTNTAFGAGDSNAFKDATTAADVADIVAGFDATKAKAFAAAVQDADGVLTSTKTALTYDGQGKTYTASALAQGYWAIVDETPDATNLAEEHMQPVVLQVVGDTVTEVNIKVSSISFGKEEQENRTLTVSQKGDGKTGYGDTADYANGDEVPFRIWSSVPADYMSYAAANGGSGYKLQFNDTLGTGLTFTASSVKAYLVDMSGTTPNFNQLDDSHLLTGVMTATPSGQTVTFANSDLTAVSGKDFAGKAVVITYTAKLDASAVSATGIANELTVTHTSDKDGHEDTTPGDKTYTFTFELDSTKVDASNPETKLSGAKFKLLNGDKTKAATIDTSTGKITGWVDYDAGSDNTGTVITSGDNGLFKVIGLDGDASNATKYYLLETEAPTGYNKLSAPIEFWIESTTELDSNTNLGKIKTLVLHVGSSTTNGTTSTGILTQNIENKQGNTLPETGGMGTMLFIAGGLVLMAVAGGAYTIRKRQA